MKLVLFDIDGTLLTSHGAGRAAVLEALGLACGREVESNGVSFAGRTDRQIMRDLLTGGGLTDARIDDLLDRCLDTYASVFKKNIRPEMVDVLPGVHQLIGLLSAREDVQLGLLTGNLEETAYLKLRVAGLADYFPFGAFGSDGEDRYALPEIALMRAYHATGVQVAATRTAIIGDTPHDIGCANRFGAVSIGVCTGPYTRDELVPCGAQLLLDDLNDPHSVLEVLDAMDRIA